MSTTYTRRLSEKERDVLIAFVRKKGGKKAFKAAPAVWKDLPDWGGSTSCPLFEKLPAELLDLCFGVTFDTRLSDRDYLALAGTCTFFRHNLNEHFFEVLAQLRQGIIPPTREAIPLVHPFTRAIFDWYKEPPARPLNIPPPDLQQQYSFFELSPSEAQYNKAYNAFWRERAIRERRREDGNKKRQWMGLIAKFHAGVEDSLVTIRGLREGEEDPQREGRKGRPVDISYCYRSQWRDIHRYSASTAEDDKRWETEQLRMLLQLERATAPPLLRWKRKLPSESAEPPAERQVVDKSPQTGFDPYYYELVPHDYWPSPSRVNCAQKINKAWISESVATTRYGLDRSQLLSLKHRLVVSAHFSGGCLMFPDVIVDLWSLI
ncbi:hypothetical protein IAT38_007380 [Cryptococcus sp. DSM 104549]